MQKKRKGLLFYILCCVSMLGFGLFSLPTAAAYFGGTLYWGYIVLGAFVALGVVVLFCMACEETVPKTCHRYFPRLAPWISMVYALGFTAVSAFLFAYYTFTVQNWFLDGVPRIFIGLFLIAICLYTATQPVRDTARLVGFVGVLVLLIVVCMRAAMLFSGDVRNLMPFFEVAQVDNFPYGALFLVGFFAPVGLLGIYPMPRRVKMRSGIFAVVTVAVLFVLASAACISILGPAQTAQHLDSTVLAMKNLNLSKLDFLQRGDILFIVTWSFLILCTATMCSQIPYRTIFALFPNLKRAWLYLLFFLVYALVVLSVPSASEAWVCLIYASIVAMAVSLVLLSVVFLWAKWREKR